MDALLQWVHDPAINSATKAGLAILLLLGGAQKLRDPVLFQGAIENYQLLPAKLAPLVAFALPAAEIVCGALLLMPATSALGALAALLLIMAITSAAALSLAQGRHGIDCGCGGLSSQPLSWSLVARNCVLAAIALVALQPSTDRLLTLFDFFLVAVGALAFIGLYAAVNQLMSNAPLIAAGHPHLKEHLHE